MTDLLEASALDRWQKEPILFIEQILRNPETGKPFELLDAERAFLAHAFQTDESGRLVYPEQLYACPKKSGKTGLAAMHLLTTTLVFERGRQCCATPWLFLQLCLFSEVPGFPPAHFGGGYGGGGGGDGFRGNHFGGFGVTPSDGYGGYGSRASGLRGGFRGYGAAMCGATGAPTMDP
jgi:hypothetical protein